MSVWGKIGDLFTSSDEPLNIQDLTLKQLNEEKANLRASIKMKRDRHEQLSEKREKLFEKIVKTDDDLLERELAEEISSIEDEMNILYNEHAELMDALRVVDGLISIKRKERMFQQHGLVDEIRDMDKQDVIEKLRRADVREMIREEKWEDLHGILKGQLSARERSDKRIDEILAQADEVRALQEDLGTEEAIQQALRERDEKKRDEVEV